MELENEFLKIGIDPEHGGRIVSFFDKENQREFVCYDPACLPVNPDLDYDGNFAGGMDELLPCDPPENGFPDHGELWTLPLTAELKNGCAVVSGLLPVCKLRYTRSMRLEGKTLVSEYHIANEGKSDLDFLWKLHAALTIEPGDRLFCDAKCIQAANPGDWSKAADGLPHAWEAPYTVPAFDGTSDFFYLTDLHRGELVFKRRSGGEFRCDFDLKVFPCAWIFASFGRLKNFRTLILEPCTNYPLTLAAAKESRVCAHLSPGEQLRTTVRWTIQ